MKVWSDTEQAFLAAWRGLTPAQRRDLERKLDKSMQRAVRRQVEAAAVMEALRADETPEQRQLREEAEALERWDREFPEESFLLEEAIPIWIIGGRVMSPLRGVNAKISVENEERAAFWARY